MKQYYSLALILTLSMLMASAAQAQLAPDNNGHYRPARGLSDPEQPDPRYAGALEVSELKEQVKLLTDAYGRLVEQHNQHADRLQALENLTRTAGPPAPRQLPSNVITIRKL